MNKILGGSFLIGVLLAMPVAALADCRNKDLMVQVEQCTAKIVSSDDTFDVGSSYLYRCQAYDMLGEYESALKDCNTALDYLPKDASIFNSLSLIYQNQGNHAQAIASATTAVTLNPERGAYFNTRSNAYCAVARYENSVRDRLEALELGYFSGSGLQEYLANQGFYSGPIDGNFGSGSKAALDAWTRNGCNL